MSAIGLRPDFSLSHPDPFRSPAPRHAGPEIQLPLLSRLPLHGFEADTLAGQIVYQQVGLDGSRGGVTLVPLDQDRLARAASVNLQQLQKTLSESALKGKAEGGDHIEIDIPFKVKSKTFRRIFGSGRIGLNVHGNINLKGTYRAEKRESESASAFNNNQNDFRLEQEQQFTVVGKIGEKVDVHIDQNTERSFDFENNLSIIYTGEPEEVIESISAGNISLNLPQTKYVSFSDRSSGLFGLKMVNRLGPLRLTGIASTEKNESKQQTFTGTSSEKEAELGPGEHLPGYFFINEFYRHQFRVYDSNSWTHTLMQGSKIRTLSFYESSTLQTGTQRLRLVDPSGQPISETLFLMKRTDWDPSLDNQPFSLDPDLGIIRLNTIPRGQFVAIGYTVENPTAMQNWFGENGQYSTLLSMGAYQATDSASVVVLYPNHFNPESQPYWDLQLRNVFHLGTADMDPAQFDMTVGKVVSGGRDQTNQDGTDYLSVLYLDVYDASANRPGSDHKVDDKWVEKKKGNIWFPSPYPFGSRPESWVLTAARAGQTDLQDSLGLGDAYAGLVIAPNTSTLMGSLPDRVVLFQDSEVEMDTLYDLRGQNQSVDPLWLDRNQRYRLRSTAQVGTEVISLGWNVTNVTVTANNKRLIRDTDYTLDEQAGLIRITNPAYTTKDQKIQVNYETPQLFQLRKKTFAGLTAELDLWESGHERSKLGAAWIYFNEETAERKIRLGNEPVKNVVLDLNAKLLFKPRLMTQWMDALPLIEADAPSTLELEAEYAMVIPDPNPSNNPDTGDGNGVAYVDDFESSNQEIPLSIGHSQWFLASRPVHQVLGLRGWMGWYNPREKVESKTIWPDYQESDREGVSNQVNVLRLEYEPFRLASMVGSGADTSMTGEPLAVSRSWGGLYYDFRNAYDDLSDKKYLEMTLLVEGDHSGSLHLDLGQISEDVLPNQQLDTEDKDGVNGLSPDEDRGLDDMWGPDPPWPLPDGLFAWSGTREQLYQQFGETYHFTDAEHTFDWWDLDLDAVRDPSEPWSYDNWVRSDGVWTDAENSDDEVDKSHGWEGNSRDMDQLYPDTEDRNNSGINLDDVNSYFSYELPLNPADSHYRDYISPIDRSQWLYVRIPLGDPRAVYEGNPQLTLVNGVRLWLSGFTGKTRVTLAELNIVGNEWRKASLAAADTLLQQTYDITVLNNYDNSDYDPPPGVTGQKDENTGVASREQSLVMLLEGVPYGETAWARKQLAANINLAEYRELKMFVHGGTNDIEAFQQQFGDRLLEYRLRLLSTENDYYEYTKYFGAGWSPANNMHILFSEITGIDQFEGARRDHEEPDKPVLLADGGQIRVVGNPSITKVRSMMLGVTNHGSEPAATQVWFNELRVSNVKKEISRAMRAEVSGKFSDVLSFNTNFERKDADYHTVKERAPREGANYKNSYSAAADTDLGRLLPPSLGLSAKLTVSTSSSLLVPKFYPNDDQEVDLDRHPEWIENMTRSRSATLTLRKTTPKGWWMQHTLDKLSFSTDVSQGTSRNVQIEADTSFAQNVRLGYSDQFKWTHQLKPLAFAAGWPLMKKASALAIGYFPQSLSLSASTRRDIRHSWRRDLSHSSTETYALSRNWNTSFKPLSTMSVNIQRSYDNNLRFRRPQARMLDLPSDTSASYAAAVDFADRLASWRNQAPNLHDGDTSIRQTLTTNWTPALLSWSTTSFSYNTTYNWTRELAEPARGVALSNSGKFSADLKLDPGKLARKVLWMSDATLNAAKKELSDQKAARKAEQDKAREEKARRREEKAKEKEKAAAPALPVADDSLAAALSLPEAPAQPPTETPAGSPLAPSPGDTRALPHGQPPVQPLRPHAEPDSLPRTPILTPRPLLADSLLAQLPDSIKSVLAAADSLIRVDASLRGKVDSSQVAPPKTPVLPDSLAEKRGSRLLEAVGTFFGRIWKRAGVVSGGLDPIDIRFSRDGSRNDPGLAVFPWTPVSRRHASLGYQLGLDPDPGFDTLRVAGLVFTTTRSFGYDYALGTRINLSKELPLKLGYDYSFSQQYSNERENSRRESRTGWYDFSNDELLGKGKLDAGELVGTNPGLRDLPNYSFSLRKLNRLPLLSSPFKDLNLSHDYKGKYEVAFSPGASGMLRSSLSYSRDYNPLAGLDFQLPKGWGGSANYKVNRSLKINDPDSDNRSVTFTRSRVWNASAQKTLKNGFKLPGIKKRFKNDTTLRLTYDNTRKLTLNSKKDTAAEGNPLVWNTPQNQSSWSLAFNTDYKFSRNVTGGANWKYGVEHSGTANDRKSYMEFQLSCRIEVRSK